jgi:hypothetical protein
VVPPFTAHPYPWLPCASLPSRDFLNPNRPRIDVKTGHVEEVVIFLRGVEPQRGRAWDHPPVRVEIRDFQYTVHQGDCDGKIGFVRRGDTVKFLSRQQEYDTIRARGAAFFSLPFRDTYLPTTRKLDTCGLVELSSGAGCFWSRAYLFVDDHPYYTRTDRDGCFELRDVPAGDYELVAWMPNWLEAERELDSETVYPKRLYYRPAVEKVQRVHVKPGRPVSVGVNFITDDFLK